jgi:hypothetical protein
MPRAALLSIHARVAGTAPDTWEDPALVQVWGPRFSAYVVALRDRAVFTLGRMPDSEADRRFVRELADDLEAFLAGRRVSYADAARGMGVHHNRLRYATVTGRIVIRWEGARRPTIWTIPAPEVDPRDARLELGRRYLHVFGPATAAGFADWAGIRPARARRTFDELAPELMPVRTDIGDGWILSSDEASYRASAAVPAPARLLPSGDTYFLLQGVDRELLVPDAERRPELWTPRVWPGAVLVDGEVCGVWRRAGSVLTVGSWRRLSAGEREAVEAEVASLPLPALDGPIVVRWDR